MIRDWNEKRSKKRSKTGIWLALFWLGSFGLEALGQEDEVREAIAADFVVKSGVVYKTVGGRKLSLHLFLPKEPKEGKMPLMLYTHGGGWAGGDVNKIYKTAFAGTLRLILEEGIACAAVTYRRTRTPEITAMDCVEDCKDAARFLVKRANEWGLDPERLGVWGGSAGGHLSLMTGLSDNHLFRGDESLAEFEPRFRCIVSYYPLTSFSREDLFAGTVFEAPEKMIPMLGGLAQEKPEFARLLSPVEYVEADSPQILLLHGEKDKVLPISQSEYFLEVAKAKGADVKLLTVKGAGHSFGGKKIAPTLEEINQVAADFMIDALRKE